MKDIATKAIIAIATAGSTVFELLPLLEIFDQSWPNIDQKIEESLTGCKDGYV